MILFGYHIPLGVLILVAVVLLIIWLASSGFFKYWAKVFDDCLFNHKTGRYEIINLGRFFLLWVFIIIVLGYHFQINTEKPYITYQEMSEWLAFIILGFVATGTAIKIWEGKTAIPDNKIQVNTETTNISAPADLPVAPAEECPAAKKAREQAADKEFVLTPKE